METARQPTLEGNVALVTGANRGLGAAVALGLARLGAHVVIAARDDSGLAATDDAIRAAGGEATLLPADLARGDIADVLGQSLYERFGRLDILVHAAMAIDAPTPASLVTEEQWAMFGINATATWRLIRATDALLRAAPHGRAVVLTDEAASMPRAGHAAFAASMAARQMLVLGWARDVEEASLRVNLFDPGTRGEADAAAAMLALCLPSETRHGMVVS